MFKLDLTKHLYGTPNNDWLYGYDTDVTFHHSAGDDWIVSGSGANKLSGGPGNDTVSYTDSTAGVHVELAYYAGNGIIPTVLATGGWAEGDVLSGYHDLTADDFILTF